MGYGSPEDLATVMEIRQRLDGARVLGILLSEQQQAQFCAVEEQLSEMTATDSFYDLVAPKHRIFHDTMSIADMAALVCGHRTNPDGAEAALIEWYQRDQKLDFLARGLSRHGAWCARMVLLQKALDDHKAERYYAVVQVLLSVMDGFVNDLDPANRKGLHAYESEDLDA